MKKDLFLLMCIGLFAFSCKKESNNAAFKSAGELSVSEVSLDPFLYLKVNSRVFVEIKIDPVFRMKVEAGRNLLAGVKAEINADTLVITNKNKFNWMRSYDDEIHITLYAPTIHEIQQNGGGRIFSTDTIRCSDFTVDMKNGGDVDVVIHVSNSNLNNHDTPGDIIARGISGVSYVYNNGQGTIDARSLQTDVTFLGSHSTGLCYVRAKDWLAVTLSYFGDVYYSGTPTRLDQKISSKGKLIHQD